MGPIFAIHVFEINNLYVDFSSLDQTFANLRIFFSNKKNVGYIHMLIQYMKLIEF
jgi:hypothetical protein